MKWLSKRGDIVIDFGALFKNFNTSYICFLIYYLILQVRRVPSWLTSSWTLQRARLMDQFDGITRDHDFRIRFPDSVILAEDLHNIWIQGNFTFKLAPNSNIQMLNRLWISEYRMFPTDHLNVAASTSIARALHRHGSDRWLWTGFCIVQLPEAPKCRLASV